MKKTQIACMLTAALLAVAAHQPSFAQSANAKKFSPNDAAAQKCVDEAYAQANAVEAAIKKARGAKKVTAADESQYKAVDAKRHKQWADAKAGGISVAECNDVNKTLGELLALANGYNAKTAAAAAAAPAPAKANAAKKDPAVAACTAKLSPVDKEIKAEMDKGRKAGAVSQGEGDAQRKESADILAEWTKKQEGGTTLKECEDTLGCLNALLAKAKTMAATPLAKKGDAKKPTPRSRTPRSPPVLPISTRPSSRSPMWGQRVQRRKRSPPMKPPKTRR